MIKQNFKSSTEKAHQSQSFCKSKNQMENTWNVANTMKRMNGIIILWTITRKWESESERERDEATQIHIHKKIKTKIISVCSIYSVRQNEIYTNTGNNKRVLVIDIIFITVSWNDDGFT